MDLWASDSMYCVTLKAGPSDAIAEGKVGGSSAWVYFLMSECITPNGWKCYAGNFDFFIGFWFLKINGHVFTYMNSHGLKIFSCLDSPLLQWPIKLAPASIPCATANSTTLPRISKESPTVSHSPGLQLKFKFLIPLNSWSFLVACLWVTTLCSLWFSFFFFSLWFSKAPMT